MNTTIENPATAVASVTLSLKAVKATLRRLKPYMAPQTRIRYYVDIRLNDPNPLAQIRIAREGDGLDFIATDAHQICIAHFPCQIAGDWPEGIGLTPELIKSILTLKGDQISIEVRNNSYDGNYLRVCSGERAIAHVLPTGRYPRRARQVISPCPYKIELDTAAALAMFTAAAERAKSNDAITALSPMKNGLGVVVYSFIDHNVSLFMSEYLPAMKSEWPLGSPFLKFNIAQVVKFIKAIKANTVMLEFPAEESRPLVIRDGNLVYATMPFSKRKGEAKAMAQHI